MKPLLIAALAASISLPVVTIPVPADAQVLAGRNAARTTRPRVSREERLENLRYAAEDRLAEIEQRIADIQENAASAGGPTPAQQRQLAQLNERKSKEEREIARLAEELGN